VAELDEAPVESLDMEQPGSAEELQDLEGHAVLGTCYQAQENWLVEVVEAVVGRIL
jgi:hypothetical protein